MICLVQILINNRDKIDEVFMQRKTLIKAAILIICTITFFVSVSLIKNSHKKEHYYTEEKQLNYEQYLSDYATGDVITFQECIGYTGTTSPENLDYIMLATADNNFFYFTDDEQKQQIYKLFNEAAYYDNRLDSSQLGGKSGGTEYKFNGCVKFINKSQETSIGFLFYDTLAKDTKVCIPREVISTEPLNYVEGDGWLEKYIYYGFLVKAELWTELQKILNEVPVITMEEIIELTNDGRVPQTEEIYRYQHEVLYSSTVFDEGEDAYDIYRMNIQNSDKYLIVKSMCTGTEKETWFNIGVVTIMNADGTEDKELYNVGDATTLRPYE